MKLKLKICGLRNASNVELVKFLQPDYMGFIFFDKSPRYVGKNPEWIKKLVLSDETEKTGVFVNEKNENIIRMCRESGIRFVQLHGQESPEDCADLKNAGFAVTKMFSVGPGFSFSVMEPYVDKTNYFLFDTRGEFLGGSGKSFDWGLIEDYPYQVPYFLSGGIGPDNIDHVRFLYQPLLFAVDVNSKLESSPGEKDSEKLSEFKKKFEALKK